MPVSRQRKEQNGFSNCQVAILTHPTCPSQQLAEAFPCEAMTKAWFWAENPSKHRSNYLPGFRRLWWHCKWVQDGYICWPFSYWNGPIHDTCNTCAATSTTLLLKGVLCSLQGSPNNTVLRRMEMTQSWMIVSRQWLRINVEGSLYQITTWGLLRFTQIYWHIRKHTQTHLTFLSTCNY